VHFGLCNSEIYDTILVEEITLGPEGCCKKVARVSRLDLGRFAKLFGFVGEISGFEFVKWESDTSFRFRFQERQFRAVGLGNSDLTISEVGAPNSAVEQPAGSHGLAAAAHRERSAHQGALYR
jgi:hypothetical protein